MLIQAFKDRVKKSRDKIAIKTKDKFLTFNQLDLLTDNIAIQIKYGYKDLDSEYLNSSNQCTVVALLFEHGIDMITGSIGALKANIAYAPFDPTYPQSRLIYMLNDSDARLIVTNSINYDLAVKLACSADKEIKILNIDSEPSIALEELNLEENQQDKIAYLLYTSGSTGIPKGVVQTQNSILYFANSYINILGLTENDKMTLFSVFSHDACIVDIYSGILSGACLYPYNMKEEANIGKLSKWLIDEEITIWHSVPTLYRYFLNTLCGTEKFHMLKYVVLGGEAVLDQDAERHRSILKNTTLMNLYGQSESSFNSAQIITPENEFKGMNLGEAIPNTNLIVLNDKNKKASKLRTGEIVVVSEHLALGYWKNEEKTKASFEQHPEFGRIYRTGDIGRENLKGSIEYQGRKDFQIKVRGYRVELEEIENCLLKHDEIIEVAVIGKRDKNGEMSLYAYVVCSNEINGSELKEYVAKKLPDYMIPTYFVKVEKMPLTPTNKIDRLELENIGALLEQSSQIEASRNEIDEKLIEIWKEILEVDNIGINHNFFDLGGHSLKATTLISKIHKQFNIEIPLRQIFKEPTIKSISDYIKDKEQSIYLEIQPIEESEYYKTSSAQKRIHTLQQFDKTSTGYNMFQIFEIEGNLNIESLEEAFNTLIQRHESFRTSFEFVEGNLVQKVNKEVEFKIDYEKNISSIDNSITNFISPFDLSKAPLLRVKLIQINPNKNLLMFDMHHIIADGTSKALLIKEFVDIYQGKVLQPLPLQYKDFAAWQNKLFEADKIKKQEQYWLETFNSSITAEGIPVLNMPTDYTRPSMQSFEGDSISFELDIELTNKIKQVISQTDSTLYMVLLTSFNILLSKYSGQEDVVIGSPIAGRPHGDLANIIGMFANTLAMRNYPKGEKTLKEFLMEVKENSLKAYENQDYQFEELVEKLKVPRDLSRNPLFDVMLVLQNMDMKQVQLQDLIINQQIMDKKTAKFDLTVTAVEFGNIINIEIEYSTSLYKKTSIERMKKHFQTILRQICNSLERKLKEVELLTEEETQQILTDFNNTKAEYPREKTIHQLFEEQVKKTPDNIAIEFDNTHLTYRQLNEKANQLARVLRNNGVIADSIVALMLERSLEMVVGIMAILKAGGAYLPIDPEYPADRVNYMLEDSGTSILLTQANIVDKIQIKGNIIDINDNSICIEDTSNLENISTAENLLYVIYTSGSTGKPKGVMLNHGVLNNLVCFQEDKTNIDFRTKVLQFTTISFDVCYQEIFSTLLCGGQLIITRNEIIRDANKLLEFIANNEIEVMFMATSYFKYIVSNKKYLEQLSKSLKHIIVAGEQLIITEDLKQYLRQNKIYLHNHYGPSEAHVVSTYTVEPQSEIPMLPPIGKPINNNQLYIIDSNYKPQPIGVAGELCIAGDGLARGYLNRPELTTEKFVDNPFSEGTKLYKTGDLARWLSDGNIEFLGRIDFQVKIRGHRIELGEIENKLLEHNEIKEAVVIARQEANGGKYLCSYLSAKTQLTISELREHLSKYLPDYMIPSYFIQLEKMPLTPNGKIDRKSLPEPDGSVATDVEYEAPRNETEAKLVDIWRETLKIDIIGINHNFFELGGHSLKATALLAKVQKELNVEIPLREMFKSPTIKGMAEYIFNMKKSIYLEIKPIQNKENNDTSSSYDTSSAQKRVYALNQLEEDSIIYNIPLVLEIEGKLDKQNLEKTFKTLIKRHEALRTSFKLEQDNLVQIVNREVKLEIEYVDNLSLENSNKEIQNTITRLIKTFDLTKAPLIRVGVISLDSKKHIIVIDIHHIIADGVSMGILTKEFASAYEGKELPNLRLQYKDYSVWQNEQLKSDRMKRQEEYWLDLFMKASITDEIPVINIPTDYPRPSMQSFDGDMVEFRINKEQTKKLKQIAKETGSTLYMVMLATFNILLSKYSGQEDIIVGSPIAGRPHGDLQNIIGMFVNTLAMRNYPKGEKTAKEFLIDVKENALKAYENQDYQFEELVEKLNVSRDMSRNPVFDIMFSMQNMDMDIINLKDFTIKPYKTSNKISKFDITLTAVEVDDEIALTMQYCTKLFKRATVEGICKHYKNIATEISQNLNKKLSEIVLLTEAEKQCILVDFNNTKADYPKHKTIHQLFEEKVKKTPNSIAIVYDNKSLTYKELNEKSNQLAKVLKDKGVKAGSIVAIVVQRSFEMIIGILGILKTGAAYLPIDPEYPQDRIDYILEDSGANIILTQKDIINKLSVSEAIILLDNEQLYQSEINNLDLSYQANSLAYIIYTSGSTGKPKGVMVEHQSVINTLYYLQDKYPVYKDDAYLLKTTYTFDVSVTELFGWFVGDGRLVILNVGDEKDPIKILESISENKVTHINFVPSMFNVFVKTMSIEQWNQIECLKYVMVAGEAISTQLVKEVNNINTTTRFENLYGPTEASIYATSYSLKNYIDNVNVPIGKPVSNSQIYILDKHNMLCPIGVAGELCISGNGLARGYLNKPELTAEKFVDNPFAPNSKMYKTGDLVRWLPDGNIEFLGRIDYQVKIRGYRIELGEIENKLLNHNALSEVLVIAKEDTTGDKYLCAYFVANMPIKLDELRSHLRNQLPEYMIPAYFIQLDSMPLNSNGKVDRRKLPEPDKMAVSVVEYIAPRNDIEEKLCRVFEEVLRVKRIGIKDNFFYLGGDSIKAIQVSARMQRYGLKLQVRDLLKNPEIDSLSRYVAKYEVLAEQGIITGEVELTPIQQWLFNSNIKNEHHFNQAVMLYSKEGFEEEATTKVFTKLIEHHDVLRSVYKREDSSIKQIIRDINEELFTLNTYNYKCQEDYKAKIEAEAETLQASISLTHGPLVKIGIFDTDKGAYMLIVIHHLVVDGVSWRIIFEDMVTAYKQLKENQKIILPKKTASYRDWAKTLKEYSNSLEIKKELKYWKQIESTEIESLRKDKEESKQGTREKKNNAVATLGLTKEQTEMLLMRVNKAYKTDINDILLTALGISINKWTDNQSIAISLEGHGREAIRNIDITRTIGWFTTMYPVVLNIENTDNLGYQIKTTKENLRKIPNKGIGYGLIKYLSELDSVNNIDFNLRPEICFNYLGQFDGDVKTEIFEAATLSIGATKSEEAESSFALDISGMVAEDKLSLSIVYSKEEYKKETIEELALIYKNTLNQIIEHCTSIEEGEVTPSDLGICKLSINELDNVLNNLAVNNNWKDIRQNIKEVYSLTPMQEGMLFYRIMDNQSTAYCEQTILDIEGQINVELYEESLNKIIERYDVLRTVFVYDNLTNPVQAVLKQRKTTIHYEDISYLEQVQRAQYIESFIETDKKNGFDLTKDILIRLSIIKVDENKIKLIWSFHHIIMDGWCIGIIMNDFMKIYSSLKNNEPLQLEEAHPYSRFISWLESQDKENAVQYWKKYLEGYEGQIVVPEVKTISKQDKYVAEEYKLALSEELSNNIRIIARDNQVTINTIIQSVWAILLQRYNNSQDVVFGAVVSGRPAEVLGIENMMGLFINTIPVRVNTNQEDSFSTVIKKVQQNAIETQKYEFSQLAEIQASTALKSNLINHIIVFENYPVEEEISKSASDATLGFSLTGVKNTEETNYDFNIAVALGQVLSISLAYNSSKYDAEYIRNIGEHIRNIIEQIADNPNIKVEDIKVITAEEKQKLLIDFNNTYIDYPSSKTIHEIFEEQVERNPNNIAVVFQDKQLTYKELNAKANQLARTLREKNLKPDALVGILIERSIEMIIAIIGVLKAGGAYLPINVEYPAERVRYILCDSNATILLSQNKYISNTDFEGTILDLSEESNYALDNSNLENINKPEDMAYVIYTSGSTGKPKGVIIEQRSVVNLCTWLNKEYNLSQNKNIMQITNISFDVAVEETLGALLNGATTFIPSEEIVLNKEKFKKFVDKHSINMVQFVPITLRELILENEKMESLQIVICGGDKLDDSLRDEVLEKGYNLYNCYGPTEITVDALTTKCEAGKTTIGKPIGNAKAYILNPKEQLQPIGIAGELCIGGLGVARGYLGRPEATAEKFIENPFIEVQDKVSGRIYKTGDLARLLPNGHVQFLGRIDNQVKIRGYRIELGEIENKLINHPVIKNAVVIVKEDSIGNKYLCGYIEVDKQLLGGKELTIGELREYLNKELPEYMIPSYFVQLEKMPLNVNDKIDRKALADTRDSMEQDGNISTGIKYEGPRNNIEAKLVGIWQEILGVKNISINDNFFEIGGHSLKATSLTAKIHKDLSVEVPLKEVFNTPTIKGISEYIKACDKNIYSQIQIIEKSENYPEGFYEISSAQKRMYVLNEIAPDSTFYNITGVLNIEGDLDTVKLEATFKKLIQRHESLRTSFEKIDENTVQRIHSDTSFNIERYELSGTEESKTEEINKIIAGFVRAFDLSKAPLLRVGIITLDKQTTILMYDMHHIISDGVSMEILTEEFVRLYEGQELSNLKLQYKDYAVWQNNIIKSGNIKKQEEYWMEEFKDGIPILKLPTDNQRPEMQSYNGDIVHFEINEEITDKLRLLCKATATTMHMALLTNFNVLLSKCSMQQDIVIGCPTAGRPNADLDKIIGMFVNTLPMRNYPKSELTFTNFLKEVKQKCLDAYENQEYQLEELINKLKLKRDKSRNPLFDIVFTHQNVRNIENEIGSIKVKSYNVESNTSKFDMTLTAIEGIDNIKLYLEYSTALFNKSTIERFISWFEEILNKLVDNPDICLAAIELDNYINTAKVEEDEDVDFDF